MLFRIVGEHNHRAVANGSTFTCIRLHTTTDKGIAITWSASKDGVVLKSDCRTLNEAKQLCRAAMPVVGGAAATAAPTPATPATAPRAAEVASALPAAKAAPAKVASVSRGR